MTQSERKRKMTQVRALATVVLTALVVLLGSLQAEAETWKLAVPKGGGNIATYAVIDDTTPNIGLYSWVTDATERGFQQWFWYRVGTTGPEAALDTLQLVEAQRLTDTSISLLYRKAGQFDIKVVYALTVYPLGEGRSSLKKTMTISRQT